jgi:hypothetical protein
VQPIQGALLVGVQRSHGRPRERHRRPFNHPTAASSSSTISRRRARRVRAATSGRRSEPGSRRRCPRSMRVLKLLETRGSSWWANLALNRRGSGARGRARSCAGRWRLGQGFRRRDFALLELDEVVRSEHVSIRASADPLGLGCRVRPARTLLSRHGGFRGVCLRVRCGLLVQDIGPESVPLGFPRMHKNRSLAEWKAAQVRD